jgi:predicted aldo/keto reductase-like oxidoreductase
MGASLLVDAVQGYAQQPDFLFPSPVYRTLGRTGLKVSVVGFGAMLTPEPEVMRVAFEHGVDYVNTSRKYMAGKNEEIVGRALQGYRDKIIVATKILTESDSYQAIAKDVEASLKALRTDHIDVLQIDANADPTRIFRPAVREAFARLKEQGKIRFCGVAVHKDPAGVLNALAGDATRFFDTVLVAYNFKSGKEVGDAIDRVAKTGVGIVAMKSQAGGYATPAGLTPHQAALKWVLQNPNIALAIPGMRDLSELRDDVAVMGMPLTAAEERSLERHGAAIDPFYCRLCGQCEGSCPKGVDISTVNRSLMYAEGYGSRQLASATYREIGRAADAGTCLDCTQCLARCPRGLDISAQMGRARRYFG